VFVTTPCANVNVEEHTKTLAITNPNGNVLIMVPPFHLWLDRWGN
jgi:hypothetical protein